LVKQAEGMVEMEDVISKKELRATEEQCEGTSVEVRTAMLDPDDDEDFEPEEDLEMLQKLGDDDGPSLMSNAAQHWLPPLTASDFEDEDTQSQSQPHLVL